MIRSRFRHVHYGAALLGLVWALSIAGSILFLCWSPLKGADEDLRDRNARAALALSTVEEREKRASAALALAAPDPRPKDKGCGCGPGCTCPGTCPACPATGKKVDPRDSFVRIKGQRYGGSGTVIWSDGTRSVVLTAAHVLIGDTGYRVRADAHWHPAQVLAMDEAADLAVLLVEVGLPAVAVADEDPAPGTNVVMYGGTSVMSRGKILRREDETFIVSCPGGRGDYSDSGDSGGGTFVGDQLVAVHHGYYTQSQESICKGGKPLRALLARIFQRRGGSVTLIVTPRTAPPAIKAVPAEDPYDWYLWDGKLYAVPKGSPPPSFGCPGGRCPNR